VGFSREEVAAVIAQKGRVPVADYLRLRVRYFADGLVLGSRGFVNEMFVAFRDRFGPRRKTVRAVAGSGFGPALCPAGSTRASRW